MYGRGECGDDRKYNGIVLHGAECVDVLSIMMPVVLL
jgi:hypothetical protein